MDRKSRIKAYIKAKTVELAKNNELDNNGADAKLISYDLKIERANVSRVLNGLWKDGTLIKIAGRPVFYLDSQILADRFPNVYLPAFVPLGEKLSSYIDGQQDEISVFRPAGSDLSQIIGSTGSLAEQIEKAKAAVSYPPYGLATIIFGKAGTRKANLANAMIDHALSSGIRNRDCPYYDIDCRNYGDSDSFDQYFFGYSDEHSKAGNIKGVLQKCENGFVLLDHIESLSDRSMDLLGTLLSRNTYSRINSDDLLPLKSMIIMTANLSAEDEKIAGLVRYVPIQLILSDLDSRGAYEKLEQIMLMFSEQATAIGRSIKVRKDVLTVLASKKYRGNLTQLDNEIKQICAKAYLVTVGTGSYIVDVTMLSLPQELIELSISDMAEKDQAKISLLLNIISNDYLIFDQNGKSNDFNSFRQFPGESAKHLLSQFVEEFYVDTESMISFDDYANENIVVLSNCSAVQLKALRTNIDPKVYQIVTIEIFRHPFFKPLQEHVELLYGILLHITNSIDRLKHRRPDDDKPSITKDVSSEEYLMARQIFEKLEAEFGFTTTNREIDYLASYLAVTGKYLSRSSVAILVIAHGNSIASDMVRYIKENVTRDIYIDAIDFNESMQLNDLLELACVKAIELNQGSGVLVVSDMEPLTTVHEAIIRKTSIPSKTVHPLTLASLVEIVEKEVSSINDLDTLQISQSGRQNFSFISDDRNEFIRNLTERVIQNTTAFIDCYKAINVLDICLNNTLDELGIQYSNDIAVKYFCHCVSMLERVIKNEAWENTRLNRFMAAHASLMNAISHNLEYANSVFGIKIPQTELIYIAEMFMPYLESK